MGIAKLVKQALGIEPPKTEEIVPAPTSADLAAVVPPPQAQVAPVPDLMKQKELLEEKKKEIEADLAKVTGDMAKSDITPQPQKITGGVNMEDKKEEVKKEEEKKEDAKKEAAITPAAEGMAAVEPPVLVTVEEKPKLNASFGIRFVQGTSFDNSYFVAEDGKTFLAVKASRIIPKPIQDKIVHALATTKTAPVDVVTPTEIVDQLVGQGVNTLATFKAAMLELEANATEEAALPVSIPATTPAAPATEGTEKTAGMMAWNESEVMKTKVKAGDAPVVAFMEETPSPKVPSGTSSKVKQFYGRLPASAAGGAAPANALNPNSAMMVKIDLLRRALEQAQAEAKDEKAKADVAIGDKNKMVKEKDDSEHSGLMESIVKDLVGKKLIDQKDEQAAIAALAKVEKKSLAQVAELLKLLGKGSKEMGPAPMPGAEKPAPMFGAEKQPKISASVVLPTFLNEKTETDIASAPSFMSKYWDAK